MTESTAKTLGAAFAIIALGAIFGGAVALFANWIASMIIDWPVTWGNWGITWGVLIVLKTIFGRSGK